MVELLDNEGSDEFELSHGLSERARTVMQALVGLSIVVLTFILLRPSASVDSDRSASPGAPDLPVPSVTSPLAAAARDSLPPAASPRGRFGLPAPLALPERVLVEPADRWPLVLMGQNGQAQLVGLDLRDGSVLDLDPINGQLFIHRVASNRNIAGFHPFYGQTVIVGSDGLVQSMPVTEMDLPIVFPAADGDGFIIHATAHNQLWRLYDDGTIAPGPTELPPDVEIRAVTNRGLVLRTPDGSDRPFDLEHNSFGPALAGRVLAFGDERHVTLSCDAGMCSFSIRGPDDGVVATIRAAVEYQNVDVDAISPSGRLLSVWVAGGWKLVDMETGRVVVELAEGIGRQSAWAPDDTFVTWSKQQPTRSTGGLDPASERQRISFYHPDRGAWSIDVDPSILDLRQPLRVLLPAVEEPAAG